MRPRIPIHIAAVCLCTCLCTQTPLRADEFEWTAADALDKVVPSMSTVLQGVGDRRPPTAAAFALQFDADVPAEVSEQMRRDLAFVGAIRGAGQTGLHAQIFARVDGPSYLRWLAYRMNRIGLIAESTRPNTIAYMGINQQMWLTPNYIKWRTPQMLRVDTVFHEARHSEDANDGWSHVPCPTPFKDQAGQDIKGSMSGIPLAGLNACDQTPLGAYGVAAIMLKNIQMFCKNCTEKVRMDAGLYGDNSLKRIIDPQAAQALKADLSR